MTWVCRPIVPGEMIGLSNAHDNQCLDARACLPKLDRFGRTHSSRSVTSGLEPRRKKAFTPVVDNTAAAAAATANLLTTALEPARAMTLGFANGREGGFAESVEQRMRGVLRDASLFKMRAETSWTSTKTLSQVVDS